MEDQKVEMQNPMSLAVVNTFFSVVYNQCFFNLYFNIFQFLSKWEKTVDLDFRVKGAIFEPEFYYGRSPQLLDHGLVLVCVAC